MLGSITAGIILWSVLVVVQPKPDHLSRLRPQPVNKPTPAEAALNVLDVQQEGRGHFLDQDGHSHLDQSWSYHDRVDYADEHILNQGKT